MAKKTHLAIVKGGPPKAPKGVNAKRWFDCQCFLRSKGTPAHVVDTITTLRRMNMWVLALSFPTNVYFQPDWKWMLEAEADPIQLEQILIWKRKLGV